MVHIKKLKKKKRKKPIPLAPWFQTSRHQNCEALNFCCLSHPLESPMDSKELKPVNPKGNQFWTFIGRTDTEAEAPILWHLIQKAYSLEKNLILGKTEGKRRRGQQRKRWLDSITASMDMNMSELWEKVKDREAWHAAVHGVEKSQKWLSDWTTINIKNPCTYLWL